MLGILRSRFVHGWHRIGTAFWEGVSDPNKGAFDFRLFGFSIIWTGRYMPRL